MTRWKATWTHTRGANARTLGTAAILVASLALILCFIAANKAFGWGVQYGDLGTWVGGIATALASGAAFVTLRELLRTRREDEDERRARALRRAKRVRVKTVRSIPTSGSALGWKVSVTNLSGHPIYDFRWNGMIAYNFDEPNQKSSSDVTISSEGDSEGNLEAVDNGETQSIEYITEMSAHESQRWIPLPQIEFTDDDGYRFCRGQFADGTLDVWIHSPEPSRTASRTPIILGPRRRRRTGRRVTDPDRIGTAG
ncbi:hypothetical protein [Rhodococcus daqingensis]|uniref:Uncharacterized protein n=1 Tax=Rhodococcus daqingensis TaxID=2479363 RepID=A0ABW2S6R5_9NOCA